MIVYRFKLHVTLRFLKLQTLGEQPILYVF